ncbi:hypothetical protein ACVWW2_005408 [Bradyrhizobium sp. LM4.3]
MQNALIQRDTGAQREDEQRNDEAPEIQLAPIAERMGFIGRTARAPVAVKQQDLVGRVDERMHRFARHGRTPRPRGGADLRDRDEDIAEQRRIDRGPRG